MNSWKCLNKTNINFLDFVLTNKYKVIEILKNDQRSLVEIIEIDGKEFVLKIPKEKNNRKWQRFVNIFRGSDSFRNYKTMEKMEKMKISSTKALFAAEKRTPFVIDSFLIMELLKGEQVLEEDYTKVIESLNHIHSKGYLHGDSQIQNFMKKDNKIYMIDLRLQKNIYGNLGRMYEFIYLQESCPRIGNYYGDFFLSLSYKVALIWNKWLHIYGRIRKKLKGKK